jgi:hypothetical protein
MADSGGIEYKEMTSEGVAAALALELAGYPEDEAASDAVLDTGSSALVLCRSPWLQK